MWRLEISINEINCAANVPLSTSVIARNGEEERKDDSASAAFLKQQEVEVMIFFVTEEKEVRIMSCYVLSAEKERLDSTEEKREREKEGRRAGKRGDERSTSRQLHLLFLFASS
jgi:hypothetical protein